jgi:peptidoglycan hydrolase-like protein with peptidoglycan-binding domain
MGGRPDTQIPSDGSLHAGMRGSEVRALQQKLRSLGYPAGAVDGIFGQQTYRAVILFQHDHELDGVPGVWQPAYAKTLSGAEPMLPRRQSATRRDLEDAGDAPFQKMNFLQRIFAWLFGGAAAAQVFGSDNILDSINGARSAFEPLQGILEWVQTNHWFMLCAVFTAAIVLIRLLRADHIKAYRNFDYQGQAQDQTPVLKTEIVS